MTFKTKIYGSLFFAAVIAVSGYFLLQPHRDTDLLIKEINEHLAKNVSLKPIPQGAPGLTKTRAIKITSKKSTIKPTLTQEILTPLRASFSHSRGTQVGNDAPKAKRIILSNRMIAVPDESKFPDFSSNRQLPTNRETLPYIVHFGRPITPEMRSNLIKEGAVIKGYLPHYAFLTELELQSLENIAKNPDVRFVTEFTPADKIQPFLVSLSKTRSADESLQLSIQTLDPRDTVEISDLIASAGGHVQNVTRLPQWGNLTATIALNEIEALSQHGAVQWIEEFVPAQMLNDQAAIPMHLNATAIQDNWYLTGTGQIVGHADTGLDTGDLSSIHPDFRGQIKAIFDWANGGSDAADYHGHGTHTAGSICGNGASSAGKYKGIAYEAKLVSQCLIDKDTGKFLEFLDLNAIYMQSLLSGAAIHSDSWGSRVYGVYDSDARATDLFTWLQPTFLPVFSAGNDGIDINNDGVVDLNGINSPATAKNVLSVGASEGDRPYATEGYRDRKWSAFSGFNANPFNTDYVSWSASVSPYMQGMAAFSSRGPTDDNRFKPEVIAPGTDIISTRSSVPSARYPWGVLPSNTSYSYNGGTSMATPLTAGSAALVRQYIVERGGIAEPSSALIKAAMIGGSRSLTPGQYGTGAFQEIPSSSPNNVEGWGQPDLLQTVHPSGLMIRLFDEISPDTGETNTYQISVEKSGSPLDIVMSWLDYPGTAGTGVTLVNDLNLNVIMPDSTLVYPNNGSSDDDRNTVESVRIYSAPAGVYTIKIIGYNVPESGGSAALYTRGAIDANPIIVHQNQSYYDANLAPYAINFKVQSLNALTNSELRVFYATGTSTSVTGQWLSVAATWDNQANYQAFIPQYPEFSTLHYYIEHSNELFCATLPQNALSSNSYFTMQLGTPKELIIDGAPGQFGSVVPEYGTNSVLSGDVFTADAYPENISTSERYACSGWSGSGDIPASGSSNTITTSILQDSSITWNWDTQYSITRQMYFEDLDDSIQDGIEWYWKDQVVPDQTTPNLMTFTIGDYYSELYAFYGWSLDGNRWPDASEASLKPLSGLVMSNAFELQANYMLFDTDADNDGLYDWWERIYFGATSGTDMAAIDLDNDLWTNMAESMDNTNPLDPASFPTPPVISVNPLATPQSARPPWIVTALIEDNFLVVEAVLEWREEGDALWQQTTMTQTEENIYAAGLNPPALGLKRVDYRVCASDMVGYDYPSFAVRSPEHSVIASYITPWIQVTPDSLGVEELTNQTTNYSFSVANIAGTDLVWTGVIATASQNFETADPGWQHSGANDLWNISTYRTWNNTPVWYCGNDNTHLYADYCHASLDTPSFTVEDHSILVFRQWMDFEEDAQEDYYWDGAVVMISTNNGASFSIVEPVSGYKGYITPNPASPFSPDQPCLGGTGTGWETVLVDLARYAGHNAIIRFVFGSDGATVDEGWYIAGTTLLSTQAPPPPWISKTGGWEGTLPVHSQSEVRFEINPLLMQTNSENVVCLRVDSNDPFAEPLIDLILRRCFAISSSITGSGSVVIDDPVIFRDEVAKITINADYGSYISNITINGENQVGDYSYADTNRLFLIVPVTNDMHFGVEFALRRWTLTVDGALGFPSPAEGEHNLPHGYNVNASVTTPALDANPMIRYDFDDYLLSGVHPESDAPAFVSFVMTNNASLTWLWVTNFQLKAVSQGNGVVVPGLQWYVAGSRACTTGYPSSYYHFDSWHGDMRNASFSGRNGENIDMQMMSPRSISASFAPNLTALHGVPEYWLASYGFTGDLNQAAEGDLDADQMETWKEWYSDTNPTNPLSLLQLSSIQIAAGLTQLQWIGGLQRTQQLQSAATPAGPWISIYTNRPPTAVTNSIQLPYAGSNRFFRVVVP